MGLGSLAGAIADAGYRCLCPALPGYWPSSPAPDGDYGPEAVGRDLLTVLDELGLDHVAYVGHDWGAELGYPLVAAAPQRFSAFVALATPHPTGYAVRREVFAELQSAWYALFLAFAPGAPEIARQDAWLTALVDSWSPGLEWPSWPLVRSMLQRPGVMEAVCSYYRANLEASSPAPVLAAPTTIIHGERDGCISPRCYDNFDGYFTAGLRRHLLPDVGHWPHLEAPEQVHRLILAALST